MTELRLGFGLMSGDVFDWKDGRLPESKGLAG